MQCNFFLVNRSRKPCPTGLRHFELKREDVCKYHNCTVVQFRTEMYIYDDIEY